MEVSSRYPIVRAQPGGRRSGRASATIPDPDRPGLEDTWHETGDTHLRIGTFATEALEFAAGEDHGNGLAPPGQGDFTPGLGLVDDLPQVRAGFGDRVLSHVSMYSIVYTTTNQPTEQALPADAAWSWRQQRG